MGGYYDNDFITELEGKIKIGGGEKYVKRMVYVMGPIIEQDPQMYRTFGVYWWAIKMALKKYYHNKSAWFMGIHSDNLMLERAWHGSLFRTVLAGLYYHQGQIYNTADHEYTNEKGDTVLYSLFDGDAGQ